MKHSINNEGLAERQLIDDFYLAFAEGDFQAIQELLHEKGVFFATMNRKQAINHLQNLVNLERPLFDYDFIYKNDGESCDDIIGQRVLEIRFVPNDPFDDQNAPSIYQSLGMKPSAIANEKVILFALEIVEEKIVVLRHPAAVCKPKNKTEIVV